MSADYAAVVGSIGRTRTDEGWLLAEVKGALSRTNARVNGPQPLQATPGDRFQGVYESASDALNATLYLRLLLHDLVDVHVGIGLGSLDEVRPEASPRDGDGPAWWDGREALDAAADRQQRRGLPQGWRTAVFRDGDADPVLDGLVMLREQLLSRMDDRDVYLVLALLDGASVTEAARDLGISQQAASRRLGTNGGYALLQSWQQMKRAGP
jgi:hypothetical protein